MRLGGKAKSDHPLAVLARIHREPLHRSRSHPRPQRSHPRQHQPVASVLPNHSTVAAVANARASRRPSLPSPLPPVPRIFASCCLDVAPPLGRAHASAVAKALGPWALDHFEASHAVFSDDDDEGEEDKESMVFTASRRLHLALPRDNLHAFRTRFKQPQRFCAAGHVLTLSLPLPGHRPSTLTAFAAAGATNNDGGYAGDNNEGYADYGNHRENDQGEYNTTNTLPPAVGNPWGSSRNTTVAAATYTASPTTAATVCDSTEPHSYPDTPSLPSLGAALEHLGEQVAHLRECFDRGWCQERGIAPLPQAQAGAGAGEEA